MRAIEHLWPGRRPWGRLALAVALVAAGAASGQDSQRQSPFPTAAGIYGAAFLTPQRGFVAASNGALLETTDGGRTWAEELPAGSGAAPLYNIRFFDQQHGWAIGNNDGAYRTVDGGESWTPMPTPAGSWYEVEFFSPTSGVIGANGALAATTDGGVSWEVRSGYPTCPVVYGMDFRDQQIGLVSGDQISGPGLGVYRTGDGGRTWSPALDLPSNDVAFLTPDTAIATVYSGGFNEIYITTDAGLTWEPTGAFFEENGPEFDLEVVTEEIVAGISAQGAISMSHDGGFSWRRTAEPIGTLPFSWRLHFADELHGYACGPAGLLRATDDGGETWRLLTRGVGVTMDDIEMFDDHVGLAVAGNYVVRTEDGGENWVADRLQITGPLFGRDESLVAVDFIDRDTVVVAGPGGVVFQSFDSGETWSSIGYPALPAIDITDVEFISATEGWVTAGYAFTRGLYHTTDGFNWEKVLDFGLASVQFVDEDHGWAQMVGGRQFRTTDGGRSWEDRFQPTTGALEDMEFIDRENGWVVGWDGVAMRTIDGGVTWQRKDFGHYGDIGFGVDAVSPQEAWIIGRDEQLRSVLLHTTDSGETWDREIILDLYNEPLTDLERGSGGRVWLAGWAGMILHRDGGCYADCDGSSDLDFFDFLCFQNQFAVGAPVADCDDSGDLDFFDFLCFQNAFAAGCP